MKILVYAVHKVLLSNMKLCKFLIFMNVMEFCL